jgi:hypothetical protein
MIEQQERNVSADNQAIDALQKQLTTMIPATISFKKLRACSASKNVFFQLSKTKW